MLAVGGRPGHLGLVAVPTTRSLPVLALALLHVLRLSSRQKGQEDGRLCPLSRHALAPALGKKEEQNPVAKLAQWGPQASQSGQGGLRDVSDSRGFRMSLPGQAPWRPGGLCLASPRVTLHVRHGRTRVPARLRSRRVTGRVLQPKVLCLLDEGGGGLSCPWKHVFD